MKIGYDAGHGIYTPGKRSPDDEREWRFNNTVVVAMANELRKYQGVQLLRTDDPTGKTDIPLRTRTDRANRWGAQFYISVHHNALYGNRYSNVTGAETFIIKESNRPIATKINNAIVQAMGIQNRGVKYANFHITRETWCPSVLTEGGFMDSNIDIHRLRDTNRLCNQGILIARAIANHYGLKLKKGATNSNVSNVKPVKPPVTKKKAWRVVRIVHTSTAIINRELERLKKAGYTDVQTIRTNKGVKITVGTFTVKDNANQRLIDLRRRNFNGVYAEEIYI